MVGWSGLGRALRRLGGLVGGRGLSEEAIGILLETARSGERDFPETEEGRAALDELLHAGHVEIYQPGEGGPVFTRRGSIHEAFELQTHASRPRLAITSRGEKLARRLSPRRF